MRQLDLRVNPIQAKILERESAEEWGGQRKWKDGSAVIVKEPRPGEIGRSYSPANPVVSFEDENRTARLGKMNGG
jgi:hypothetical protein